MLTGIDLQNAILFAVKAHKNQKRKTTGAPYVLHPIAVLSILYTFKKSKNIIMLAICALLHDVVEDCDVSLKKIARKFGHNVASIVGELTTDKVLCDAMGKTDYLIFRMTNMSKYALVIKLCDRLHNISDMTVWNDYMTSTQEIIIALERDLLLTETQSILIDQIKIKMNSLCVM